MKMASSPDIKSLILTVKLSPGLSSGNATFLRITPSPIAFRYGFCRLAKLIGDFSKRIGGL